MFLTSISGGGGGSGIVVVAVVVVVVVVVVMVMAGSGSGSRTNREFKICYGEVLLRRQEATFISGIFTAHARVWVSGRSRTVCYGKTTKLAYC